SAEAALPQPRGCAAWMAKVWCRLYWPALIGALTGPSWQLTDRSSQAATLCGGTHRLTRPSGGAGSAAGAAPGGAAGAGGGPGAGGGGGGARPRRPFPGAAARLPWPPPWLPPCPPRPPQPSPPLHFSLPPLRSSPMTRPSAVTFAFLTFGSSKDTSNAWH